MDGLPWLDCFLIREAIQLLSNGKSCAMDGLVVEMLKELDDDILGVLGGPSSTVGYFDQLIGRFDQPLGQSEPSREFPIAARSAHHDRDPLSLQSQFQRLL